MMTFQIECVNCHQLIDVPISEKEYWHWHFHQAELPLIQHHFPELTDSEREILISGVCGKCFDVMFSNDETCCLGDE